MARSEFRWNKKRKHYAYLHKDIGTKRKNILITSKPVMQNKKGKVISNNILLAHHPNAKKDGQFYLVNRNYLDEESSFDNKQYMWKWNKDDKRKVKRVKKNKYK